MKPDGGASHGGVRAWDASNSSLAVRRGGGLCGTTSGGSRPPRSWRTRTPASTRHQVEVSVGPTDLVASTRTRIGPDCVSLLPTSTEAAKLQAANNDWERPAVCSTSPAFTSCSQAAHVCRARVGCQEAFSTGWRACGFLPRLHPAPRAHRPLGTSVVPHGQTYRWRAIAPVNQPTAKSTARFGVVEVLG